MVFENGVKNMQATAYNGARTVCHLHHMRHKCVLKTQEYEIENAPPERIPTNYVEIKHYIGEMFMMLPCQPRSDRYGMSPMH